jgi:hypothetical protein
MAADWAGDECGWMEWSEDFGTWIERGEPWQQQGSHSFEPTDEPTSPVVRQPIGFMRDKPIVRVKARTAPLRVR